MDDPIRARYGPEEECLEDGCGKRPQSRGYCYGHYGKHRRHGDFPEIAATCSHRGCLNPASVLRLCTLHYSRLKSGLGLDYSYVPSSSTVHLHLKCLWGAAREYPCVECGKPASEWAYDGTDPMQLLDTQKLTKGGAPRARSWYSQWPEFYMPMCKKCHSPRDWAKACAELLEYREWKLATRMTLSDLNIVKVGVPN